MTEYTLVRGGGLLVDDVASELLAVTFGSADTIAVDFGGDVGLATDRATIERLVVGSTGSPDFFLTLGVSMDGVQRTLTLLGVSDLQSLDSSAFVLGADGDADSILIPIGDTDAAGGGGPDVIDGSGATGNLRLFGEGGGDILWGGAAGDELLGGDGIDTLSGGAGGDALLGGDGDDTLNGDDGDDGLSGGDGGDRLSGGTGSDILDGGAGFDTLDGGDGNDWFDSVDPDSIDGGSGADSLRVIRTAGSSDLTLDISAGGGGADIGDGTTVAAIEQLQFLGGGGRDRVTGGALDDWIDGGTGDDTLVGGGGIDTLSGGDGVDRLFGGAYLFGGNGNDVIVAGAPTGSQVQTAQGGDGSDQFFVTTAMLEAALLNGMQGVILSIFGGTETERLTGVDTVNFEPRADRFAPPSSDSDELGDFEDYVYLDAGYAPTDVIVRVYSGSGNFGAPKFDIAPPPILPPAMSDTIDFSDRPAGLKFDLDSDGDEEPAARVELTLDDFGGAVRAYDSAGAFRGSSVLDATGSASEVVRNVIGTAGRDTFWVQSNQPVRIEGGISDDPDPDNLDSDNFIVAADSAVLLGRAGTDFFQVTGDNATIDGGSSDYYDAWVSFAPTTVRIEGAPDFDGYLQGTAIQDGNPTTFRIKNVEAVLTGGGDDTIYIDIFEPGLTIYVTSGGGRDTITVRAAIASTGFDTPESDDFITLSGGSSDVDLYFGNDTFDGGNDAPDGIDSDGVNYATTGGDYTPLDGISFDLSDLNADGYAEITVRRGGGLEDEKDLVKNIESFLGSTGNDTMRGGGEVQLSGYSDQFDGFSGIDVLEGRDGNDLLNGGANDDTLDGGDGADVLYGGSVPSGTVTEDDDDRLIGGRGSDTIYGDRPHGSGEPEAVPDDDDIAVYFGARADYDIEAITDSYGTSGFRIAHGRNIGPQDDGVDEVYQVENFEFADATILAADLLDDGNLPIDFPEPTWDIVPENAPLGTVVATLSASDGNGNPVSFSLSGADSDLVDVRANGDIVLSEALDFENSDGFLDFTTTATSLGAGIGSTASRTLKIGIGNVNEPIGSFGFDGLEVNENAIPGTFVGSLSYEPGLDPDNLPVTFEVDPAGPNAGLFEIVGGTALRVRSGAVLDYEGLGDHLSVDVVARSNGDPTLESTATRRFSVALNNVNEPPQVLPSLSIRVDEDAFHNENGAFAKGTVIDVAPYISDPEDPDSELTITATVAGLVPYGPGSLSVSGSDITFVTPQDHYGWAIITYTVTDTGSLVGSGQINVDIVPVNDTPVAADDAAVVNEDGTVVINVAANDTDIDGFAGRPIPSTVQIVGANPLSKRVEGEGTWSVNPAIGAITFAPEPNYTGPVTDIAYTIADGAGVRSSQATVSVTINDRPIADAETVEIDEDTVVTIDVAAGDTDAEDGAPDPTTVRIVGADATSDGRARTVTGEGTWTVNATNGAIAFSPATNYAGPVTDIAYTIADSAGLQSTPATVGVTIRPVNDAPVADAETVVIDEDAVATIDVVAGDIDIEDGTPDPTTVQIAGADAGSGGRVKTVAGEGTWSVDAATGEITFDSEANYAGSVADISYTIADGGGLLSAPAKVSVTLRPVNDAPVNAMPAVATVAEDAALAFAGALAVTVADVDGDALTTVLSVDHGLMTVDSTGAVEVAGNGSSEVALSGSAAAINAALEALIYAPVGDYFGADMLSVGTSDGVLTDTDTIALSVTPVDDTPVNTPPTGVPVISDTTPTEGQVLTARTAGISDLDGIVPGSFTFRWEMLVAGVWTPIAGATSATFKPAQAQVERFIRAVVGFTDNGGRVESVTSAPSDLIVGRLYIGTNNIDRVNGTPGEDDLRGNDGSDTINGLGANDILSGGNGVDTLYGEDGHDTLNGDGGNDTLHGGRGGDALNGGVGADTLNGNAGNDRLNGDAGDDTLNGGEDGDGLFGGDGADLLNGDAGDDRLEGAAGADTLNGGAGADGLLGGDGSDLLNGDAGVDFLDGGLGDDTLNGGADADTLNGGIGNDMLTGHAGADTLNGDFDGDTLNGGADGDTLNGGAGADTLNGDAGADTLNGDLGADTLNGGDGGDHLHGGDAADTLIGGAGVDTLFGGAGTDTFVFNSATDSGPEAAQGDLIPDFYVPGAGAGDLINLAAIDAIAGGSNNEAFIFLGVIQNPFPPVTAAGSLWLRSEPSITVIYGNTGGGNAPELAIRIFGPPASYEASDFVL